MSPFIIQKCCFTGRSETSNRILQAPVEFVKLQKNILDNNRLALF
jgi:hypothetical protein